MPVQAVMISPSNDYPTEEVFQQQPQAIQDFLMQIAVLKRLSGPLCAAVTG